MSRQNLESGVARGLLIGELIFDQSTVTLAGALTLTKKSVPLHFIDPGGAGRTITLPAEAVSEGLVFIIHNTADAAEILTIEDDAAGAVATPTQNEMAIVYCNGVAWHGAVLTTES